MTPSLRVRVVPLPRCLALVALAALGCARADSETARGAPDGAGGYTAAQAARGRAVYLAHCADCHGGTLEGGRASALAGPAFLRSWSVHSLTADELYFVTRTTMPQRSAGKLSRREYLDVLAYILSENEYPPGAAELTEDVLRRVTLVSKDTAGSPGLPPFSDGASAAPVRVPTTSGPSQAELDAAAPADWPTSGRDYAGTKYSPLDRITTANVNSLRPVCAYEVGGAESFQTMPVVYRGTMYVTTARLTLALDARTCRLRWKHEWPGLGADPRPRNRGVALKDGRVVRGTTDGYLLALDAATGDLLWARRAADPLRGETFTMPPLIFGDLVLIGPGIGEHAISGWVGAFRLADGEPVWRTATIEAKSWPSPDAALIGGAGVWTPFTLDRDAGVVYVATGNPAPAFAGHVRTGANLYANSLLALDLRTGSLRWFRQMIEHDVHDWDFTHAGPLFRAPVGGIPRDLIAAAGKDGLLRLLDRRSHDLLYETAVTTRRHVDARVTTSRTHVCPGQWGGVQWNGPAYHPGLATVFVNAVDWCGRFKAAREVRHVPGRNYVGGSAAPDPPREAAGWLTAVDAGSGRIRWRYRSPAPLLAAIATTAGGVVFTGELTGDFLALDGRTGAVLYRVDTGAPVGGGVASYAVDGRQFVAVMSGRPSRNFAAGRHQGSAVVRVFGLP